jgi:proline dehydrogenase
MDIEPDRWTLPDWPKTLEWCQVRNSQGIRCIIDVLGEYATTEGEASASRDAYQECIRQIQLNKLGASISIKLSALGGMFDQELCQKNAIELARSAHSSQVGFEIDMEGKQSVDLTIQVTKACAAVGVPVTIALQAYLRRTLDDLDELSGLDNIRFRLVKGAYVGDTTDQNMINESYKLLTQALTFLAKPYCVATHDPEILDWMKFSGVVDPCKTEFSFLKGLADRTKLAFGKNNLLVSEYVPFGKESGPYVARRMKYLRDLEEQKRSPAP